MRVDAEGDIDVGEELEQLERLLDRVKVLYEQHFMGIQKIAPETLHRQIERRMLKLTQIHIRNTALRYRFTTLSQKYGSYNTYWRRTMRAIEQGRYTKHLQLAARRREHQGKAMPEEMLASLPKRLRQRIIKDRDRLAKRAERESARDQRGLAVIRQAKPHRHEVAEADAGDVIGFDAMFDAIQTDDKGAAPKTAPTSSDEPDTIQQSPLSFDDIDASFESIEADHSLPEPVARPAPKPAPTARPVPRAKPAARTDAAPRAKPVPRARPTAGAKRDARGHKMPPGMTEHQTRDLFDKYVKAKKLCGESTDKITYAKLLRTINKQAPIIMKQHGAKSVDFNVVIKDDKVVLKAKPRK